jgi:hypothetical protein
MNVDQVQLRDPPDAHVYRSDLPFEVGRRRHGRASSWSHCRNCSNSLGHGISRHTATLEQSWLAEGDIGPPSRHKMSAFLRKLLPSYPLVSRRMIVKCLQEG